ncbi:sirohydrochlorin chelatase [Desulfotomaculum sp. 1211_IL3151]|uniref:sirohydrochlorin chelatase n=1 Tax=Desulfotomaculum sp. 1211_IL3151 TaxID=3084055 RepID=UPI002FD92FBC
MQKGVIILGHGSRYQEANREVFQITEQVKTVETDAKVETGFLQFAEPTLPQIVEEMNQQGVKVIIVVPLLLTWGSHIQQDLPILLQAQKRLYPHITFQLAPHLGVDRRIAEIILDRVNQGKEIGMEN